MRYIKVKYEHEKILPELEEKIVNAFKSIGIQCDGTGGYRDNEGILHRDIFFDAPDKYRPALKEE